MRTPKMMNNEEYTKVGKRFSSTDIAWEAQEALARWRRDVTELAQYGFGEGAMAAFVALRDQHARLMEERPDGISEKKLSVLAKNECIHDAWVWTEKCVSLLGTIARTDAACSVKLKEACPSEDLDLVGKIPTLAALLRERAAAFSADAMVEARLAEVEGLVAKLSGMYGEKAEKSAQTRIDTAEIDLLDGKIYLMMRDFYEAGRRAVRAGQLGCSSGEYRFHVINNGKAKPVVPPKDPPVA